MYSINAFFWVNIVQESSAWVELQQSNCAHAAVGQHLFGASFVPLHEPFSEPVQHQRTCADKEPGVITS